MRQFRTARTVCRRSASTVGSVLTWTAAAAMTFRPSAALVAQPPQEAAGSNVVTTGRPWMLDAVIVGALFAMALFVICRSSRRN